MEDHFEWAFVGVYSPNLDRELELLWRKLAGIYSLWNILCCVGGHFNIFPLERLEGEYFSQAMHDFSNFISMHGLVDIPLKGG